MPKLVPLRTRSAFTALVTCTAVALSSTACDLSAPEQGEILGDGRVEVIVTESPAVAAYLLELRDGSFALVDTGADATGGPIVDALNRRGSDARDISALFITHGHGDHLGAAPLFDDATLFAMERERWLIEGRANPVRPLPSVAPPEETGLVVDEEFTGDDRIEIGGSVIDVFAVPGHTDGSAAYLFAGVLFLGDAVLGTTDGNLVNTPWVFSTSQQENVSSLTLLVDALAPREDEITTIAPSHSAPLHDGLAPLRALVEQGGL